MNGIRKLSGVIFVFIILMTCATLMNAQVASGGSYKLEQSVLASGGASSSSGNFKVEGTIGQSSAGTNSANGQFAVQGGFWTQQASSPTAATVTISGRVLTTEGRGLSNARIVLTDLEGNERTTVSGSLGYYSFSEVEVGQIYIITVISKRYVFQSQSLTILEEIGNLNFAAHSVR